jgi:hypothetical protein
MNDMRFLRQQDVVDAEKVANLQVTLIGLGSIGSVTWIVSCQDGRGQADLLRCRCCGRTQCQQSGLWDV